MAGKVGKMKAGRAEWQKVGKCEDRGVRVPVYVGVVSINVRGRGVRCRHRTGWRQAGAGWWGVVVVGSTR